LIGARGVGEDRRMTSDDQPIIVLVHSPATGPAVWEPVAQELERRQRHHAVVALGDPVDPAGAVATVVDAITGLDAPAVVVGHAGAGALLPAIADAAGDRVSGLIFVDAHVPPLSGAAVLTPPEALGALRDLAQDGVLPPWHTWFPADVWHRTLPEEALRAKIEADTPSRKLAFFEGEIAVPDGWADARPCAYLLLDKEVYGAEADKARDLGWPVVALRRGGHLHGVRDPGGFASDGILPLIRQMTVVAA
jgi:pimeloyl-ACP methyl ester carboxylesterase